MGFFFRNRDNTVRVLNRVRTANTWIESRQGRFFLRPDWLWAPSSSLLIYILRTGFCPWGKAARTQVHHLPPSSTEIKDEWSYTCVPRICFHGVCRNISTLFVYVVPRIAVTNFSDLLCARDLSIYRLRAPLWMWIHICSFSTTWYLVNAGVLWALNVFIVLVLLRVRRDQIWSTWSLCRIKTKRNVYNFISCFPSFTLHTLATYIFMDTNEPNHTLAF